VRQEAAFPTEISDEEVLPDQLFPAGNHLHPDGDRLARDSFSHCSDNTRYKGLPVSNGSLSAASASNGPAKARPSGYAMSA